MGSRHLWFHRLRTTPSTRISTSLRTPTPVSPSHSDVFKSFDFMSERSRLSGFSVGTNTLLLADGKSRFSKSSIFVRKITCIFWSAMGYSHGTVDLVISDGKPMFETKEYDPPKKEKWLSKKRLKMKRMREKKKRREANTRDPRCLRQKGKRKNPRFPNAEARLKYKIEKAKIKEATSVEKLKRYEVPKHQGPTVKPDVLSGEERFYMKKMAQKRSNYVPVGRRGIFGGVILNMHLHWKKHETVKVICKPCKPGQVHEYAREIARLSGGIPIQVIGDDAIIFYRGKNYSQPEIMSPVDTLSKKRALQKSKYEQSLETVRHFIALSEKELELYYRHVALYGDPTCRDLKSGLSDQKGTSESRLSTSEPKMEKIDIFSANSLSGESDFNTYELSDVEDDSDFRLQLNTKDDSEVEDKEETVCMVDLDKGRQKDCSAIGFDAIDEESEESEIDSDELLTIEDDTEDEVCSKDEVMDCSANIRSLGVFFFSYTLPTSRTDKMTQNHLFKMPVDGG